MYIRIHIAVELGLAKVSDGGRRVGLYMQWKSRKCHILAVLSALPRAALDGGSYRLEQASESAWRPTEKMPKDATVKIVPKFCSIT